MKNRLRMYKKAKTSMKKYAKQSNLLEQTGKEVRKATLILEYGDKTKEYMFQK